VPGDVSSSVHEAFTIATSNRPTTAVRAPGSVLAESVISHLWQKLQLSVAKTCASSPVWQESHFPVGCQPGRTGALM
jgi:hypothetical protein